MRAPLIVFAKEPQAGLVKTRMTPPLDPVRAAAFYRCMLHDVLETSERAARLLGLEPVLTVHPAQGCAELAALAGPGFRVVAQVGPDLAARMDHAVREAAAAGAPFVLIRGSDSPTLAPETIHRAVEALAIRDLVLCPDRDGGYQLVGLRRPAPRLFDHAMTTSTVLEDTLAGARRLGLDVEVLTPGFDLDTIEDVALLLEASRKGWAGEARRTLAFIDEHDLADLLQDGG